MTAEKYIRRIRNWHKQEYARAYWRFLIEGGEEPCWQCSYMAAQAVRTELNEFNRNNN